MNVRFLPIAVIDELQMNGRIALESGHSLSHPYFEHVPSIGSEKKEAMAIIR